MDLQLGWLDGIGATPSKETQMRAIDFALYLGKYFKELSVFPDIDGGIQFEWVENNISVSLLLNGNSFLLGASDLKSEGFREKNYKGISYAMLRELSNLELFIGKVNT